MANITDILYGLPPSGSNTVDWDGMDTHTHVVSLSGSIDRMMTLTRPASGEIADGAPVILNIDGTVSSGGKVPDTLTQALTASNINGDYFDSVYDPDTGRLIFVYGFNGGTRCVTAVVSGGSLVYGVVNDVNIQGGAHDTHSIGYDSINQKVVIMWNRHNSLFNEDTLVVVGDVIPHATDPTQDSMSFGSILDIDNYYLTTYNNVIFDPSSGVMFMTRDANQDGYKRGFTTVATVSGSTVLWGKTSVYQSGTIYDPSSVYDPDEEKVILLYQDDIKTTRSVTGTVSTTGSPSDYEITWAVPNNVSGTGNSALSTPSSITYDPINKRVVAVYKHATDHLYSSVGKVNGDTNSISWGTPTKIPGTFDTAISQSIHLSFDVNNGMVVLLYRDTLSHVVTSIGKVYTNTETCVFWSPTTLYSDSVNVNFRVLDMVYDPPNGLFVTTYNDISNQAIYTVYTVNTSNIDANNFLGISQGSSDTGNDCVVGRYGFLAENMTGLIPGSTYVDEFGYFVNYDSGVYVGIAISDTKLLVKG